MAGIGELAGGGTADIPFRNEATSDTGYYKIVNGVDIGWVALGQSATALRIVACA